VNLPFCFSESRSVEPLRNKRRRIPGVVVRRQEGLEGVLRISAEPAGAELYKATVCIFNHTPLHQAELEDSEAVMMRTFASTHTILRVQGGEFVSLTDPPPDCRDWADKCKNFGTWPVLVGDETKGERYTLLSSPIILSDYPKIAPESQGNLFDGTEIDEMLTLRILTMTDEELHEMRHLDEHSRRVLERTEAMRPEQLMKMHGVMREESSFDEQIFGTSQRLEDVAVGGVRLRPGDRVRIRPKARADVMDLALNGKTAVIEAVEQDAEGGIHLALVLPDDPGKDLGLQRQTGHRFFYKLDEIEPLGEGS
jgi:hydrogenase maturation protease